MNTRPNPSRLARVAVIGLSVSLLVAGLAHAGNNAVSNAPRYDLTTELEQLGQHLEASAERAMNYSNARWTDMTSDSPLKIDLIEARFHLQNVVIDQDTGHEAVGADNQLGEVQKALDKAMTEADEYWTDPLYKQQISAMQAKIGHLLQTPAEIPGAITDGQLAKVQQELQMIINSL
ncbi:hypothetical protein [Thiothrix nivea]|uniref:Uncharacterized protein n=1 Tax=Thiothrix nivea (strain ATCC 35100 / DSM 5205 / JP2) TaxID=870187 RepID=A0A656HL03_THINJ|nr:hypothetical protein [Thiothrix nivea]EIJ36922.1 hypothetical protein Thini_4444 [Thiothrix nivea DSM 5205]